MAKQRRPELDQELRRVAIEQPIGPLAFTDGVANSPVASAPHSPPRPWQAKTSSDSSTRLRPLMNLMA